MLKEGILKLLDFKLSRSEGHLGGYRIGKPDPGTWCPRVWEWAVRDLKVRSVIDVGCGLGFATRYFKRLGCEAHGVEGSESAIRNGVAREDVAKHDYTSGPYVLNRSFDLVWCAEFVEHVEERYLEHFLATFKMGTKYLMITYAYPGQGGHHHVNEQPESYWIEKFKKIQFKYDRDLTCYARELTKPNRWILPEGIHFFKRGLVFKKES